MARRAIATHSGCRRSACSLPVAPTSSASVRAASATSEASPVSSPALTASLSASARRPRGVLPSPGRAAARCASARRSALVVEASGESSVGVTKPFDSVRFGAFGTITRLRFDSVFDALERESTNSNPVRDANESNGGFAVSKRFALRIERAAFGGRSCRGLRSRLDGLASCVEDAEHQQRVALASVVDHSVPTGQRRASRPPSSCTSPPSNSRASSDDKTRSISAMSASAAVGLRSASHSMAATRSLIARRVQSTLTR